MKFKRGDMCIVVKRHTLLPDWIAKQLVGRVGVLSRVMRDMDGYYWSMEEPLVVLIDRDCETTNGKIFTMGHHVVMIHEDNLQLVKRGDLDTRGMEHEEWVAAYEAMEDATAKDLKDAIDSIGRRQR